MLIQLNRFNEINNTLGHYNGQVLLNRIANRLSQLTQHCEKAIVIDPGHSKSSCVAALDSGAFILLLNTADRSVATLLAGGIISSMDQPFCFLGMSIQVDVSIGITFYPDNGNNMATLLRHAQIAAEQAAELDNCTA